MQAHISIRLFATLSRYTPASADNFPVEPGIKVNDMLRRLGVPENEVKLIFINGKKGEPTSTLQGGERVGIFPPVGGG